MKNMPRLILSARIKHSVCSGYSGWKKDQEGWTVAVLG